MATASPEAGKLKCDEEKKKSSDTRHTPPCPGSSDCWVRPGVADAVIVTFCQQFFPIKLPRVDLCVTNYPVVVSRATNWSFPGVATIRLTGFPHM